MTSKKTKYFLYAGRCTSRNIGIASQFEYSRVTPSYILVYSDSPKMENGFIEIGSDDLATLSKSDNVWLQDANLQIVLNEMKRNAEEIANNIRERAQELADTLEKEMRSNAGQ